MTRLLNQTVMNGRTFHLKRGLAIDARTADCRWQGERMDYDGAGWLLMQAGLKDGSEGDQPAS